MSQESVVNVEPGSSFRISTGVGLPTFLWNARLQHCPGIRHGFFTRQGGVSCGLYASLNCSLATGDFRKNVLANRHRVVEVLEGHCLITNQQVHGSQVRMVDKNTDAGSTVEADGIVTTDRGVCIGVLGADCAPVLLAAPGMIGAAHAGWRGALLGITDAIIETMEISGVHRGAITAAIGPSIQCASYEVGEEFRERFLGASPIDARGCFRLHPDTRKVHFDLPGYIELRLREAGIRQLDRSPIDTYWNESQFFSFRRAFHRKEADYGRQISAICLL